MIGLLRPWEPVVAIQLYWLSIVFIGWALVNGLLGITGGKFIHKWRDLPLAAKFVISTATSFALFGVFTIIGYSLSLPAVFLGIFYIVSLIGAAAITYRRGLSDIKHSAQSLISSILSVRFFSPVGILIIILGIDLCLTFYIGGFMGGDGFVHVSKIRHLIDYGFTFTDAFYGTVPETRHSVTVMHTLMAIPSWFGINPITSWYASAAFFKLVKFSAVFYLAWRLLYWAKDKLRIQYAALATILTIGMFNNYFISYPAVFVGAWVMLFIIALLDVADSRNLWLLPIASLLIALTHPLASLGCALMLGVVVFALLLFDRTFFNKRTLQTISASFVLLLSTPLLAATFPNRMTDAVKNISATDFNYYTFFSHKAFRPTAAQYFNIDSYIPPPWPLWVMSILGIIGLVIFIKNRRYKLIIAAVMLFVPLLLYNPLTFAILSTQLPAWGIARMINVDQLTLVLPFLGLLLIFTRTKLLRDNVTKPWWLLALSSVVVVIFALTQSFGAVDPGQDRHSSIYNQQSLVYNDLADIQSVLPNDKGAIILAERNWDSFIIPVVAPLHVVAIPESNSTPAADMIHRGACYNLLYGTLNPALLKQANVSYVLAKRTDPTFYNLALHNPTLKMVKQNDTRVLFKFNGAKIVAAHNSACYFNE